jgi:hypothetical protein
VRIANEFNVSLNVSLTNGGLKDSIQESGQLQPDDHRQVPAGW